MSCPGRRHPPGVAPTSAGEDAFTNPTRLRLWGELMRHTRTASIATIAIALGLALTAIGMNRGLPHEIGGLGSKLTVGADTWASGTAISPPLVFLVVAGLLAAITLRGTRGAARAASWLAVLTVIAIVAGLMEPVQQRIVLFEEHDLLVAVTVYASYFAWIALVVAALLRRRHGATDDLEVAPATEAAAVPAAVAAPAA
jgi:hypothetical protein